MNMIYAMLLFLKKIYQKIWQITKKANQITNVKLDLIGSLKTPFNYKILSRQKL